MKDATKHAMCNQHHCPGFYHTYITKDTSDASLAFHNSPTEKQQNGFCKLKCSGTEFLQW